jgi:uncharacterized SAM-binding protein YcdF (DUF218 family)
LFGQNPQKSDVIIVLAGDDTGRRVAFASKLYHLGYADRVLLSGYEKYMAQQALSQRIPESAILLENQSKTTFENAKYSLKTMEDK